MEILLRQFQTKSFLSICKCLEPAYSHATSWTSGNGILGKTLFHTSNTVAMPYNPPKGPRKWPIYNKKIFAPQLPGEERRPAVSFNCSYPENHSSDNFVVAVCLPHENKHQIQPF